jgi:hypothetical protein
MDLLIKDGEILSQSSPVNCLRITHRKKSNHG